MTQGINRLIDLRKIEDLVERISKVLPPGANELRTEVRENIKLVLESSFARMNLVTREEFDAQSALLRRTREKLDELEQLIASLEK
jgi:BMFP domain-containing protein YqiC